MTNRPPPAYRWFDAHLDLAYMAATGRDMLAQPSEAGGPDLPAAVTLRSLADGGVTGCLATIFTEAGGSDAGVSYPPGDAEAAHRAGLLQLEIYHAWATQGHARLPRVSATEVLKPAIGRTHPPLITGILIEGADPIRSPDELPWWRDRGVVAVGMAWWRPSRYAGGNGCDPADPRAGLSDLGRALVRQIDGLDLLHDASHLSDRALDELFAATDRVVVASHSNCRALMGDPANQRHLTDASIREIARRGGVIGLNLYSRFLSPLRDKPEQGRATIGDCIAHIEHICGLTASRRHVGLGSDMDGGFSAARLPEGMNHPRDLRLLADALAARGWTTPEIDGFAFGNWSRVLAGRLPSV